MPAFTQSLMENAGCETGAEAGGTQRTASPGLIRRLSSNPSNSRGLVVSGDVLTSIHFRCVLSHFSTADPSGTWLITNACTSLPTTWLFVITSGAGPMEASMITDWLVSGRGRDPTLP